PQAEAERAGAVVIQKSGQNLKAGVLDPSNQETVQILERLKSQGFKVETLIISRSSFKRALGEFKFVVSPGQGAAVSGEVSLEQIEALKKELITFEALKNKLSSISAGDTGLLLEVFLSAALSLDASDVHIEPQQNQTQVRFRLDGVLQNAGVVAHSTYKLALSRIKLLSGLQLNVEDIPQDGRFTIKQKGEKGEMGEMEVEVRTSILPGAYGEYIVLRLLNPNAIKLEVKDLGLRDWLWQILEKEIKKPTGIILVTGPTGSGKTTTLYAFLKHLNQPGVKIVTLEDPIEYHLTGINQSQIEAEKGYTFAQGLRSVLRQDPNIILVGEIRDEETA
ncbi:MAG: ATPase, T2SS/T4P/T4SS family, partial [Patescibacteria group bacterium]